MMYCQGEDEYSINIPQNLSATRDYILLTIFLKYIYIYQLDTFS